MRHLLRKFTVSLLYCLLTSILLPNGAFSSVLTDPGIPDGEEIVWRTISDEEGTTQSTIICRVNNIDGRSVYEIITDSGDRKQAKHVLDKSDLRMIGCNVVRNDKDGRSKVNIDIRGDCQYLNYSIGKKHDQKKIKHYADGYNGMILGHSLRGFPFGRKEEVKLRITPPFKPGMPMWAWKMWEASVRCLGEESVTVPAGTWDCYKLEVEATSGIIRAFTSKYYFWFAKEPPHCFVKYEAEDGQSLTELIEIKYAGDYISYR